MKARGRTQTVIAFGAFTLLALAVFRPTPAQLSGTIPAFQGAAGDVLQQMWAIGHVSRTLFRDPLNLFDGNVFYPAKDTLACADHMIGQAVAGFPIWLATHNLPLEFNLLSLASYVLCALAAFAYARAQLGDTVAAALAGLVFAFNPYRFHSPQWLQVLFTPFVPLAFLFWLRFVRTLATRDWLLWVGCWVLQSLMGMYLMLYVAALTGVFGLFALVAAPQRHSPRLWKGTLLAPLAAAVLLAPTLLPYWRLRVTHGHVRTSGLDSSLSFFLPGPGTLSGALSGLGGLTPGQFGPGLLVAVLLVGGIVAARRRARRLLPPLRLPGPPARARPDARLDRRAVALAAAAAGFRHDTRDQPRLLPDVALHRRVRGRSGGGVACALVRHPGPRRGVDGARSSPARRPRHAAA